MFRNYLKIGWRNLVRNKLNSIISISGLAIGLTCCILIALFVADEMSYDKHFASAKNIYRIGTVFISGDKETRNAGTSAPYAATLKAEYPEIINSTRLFVSPNEDKYLFSVTEGNDKRSFYQKKGFFADSTFFDVFNFPFLAGDPHTALRDPNSVVISESLAQTLFRSTDAINKMVRISSSLGQLDYRVTGVFKESGYRSHIDASFFISIYSGGIGEFLTQANDFATNNMFYTYIRMRENASGKELEKKLPAFIDKYAGKDLKTYGFWKRLLVQPATDIHLRSDLNFDFAVNSSSGVVYIFLCIAVFILVIACINFMNLATARASRRSSEVGIRKVCGADRKLLIRQFISESIMISLIALLFSFVLCGLLMPAFNQLTGKDFSFQVIFSKGYWIGCFLLSILAGFLAGSYPSFYLSSFNPIQALKGKITSKHSAVRLRRGLVVFQFVISITMIVSIVIIWKQLNYLQSQELGFKKEQEIIISLQNETVKNNYLALKSNLVNQPGVRFLAGTTSYPGINVLRDMSFYTEGKNVKDAVNVQLEYTDDDYQKALDLQLISGRYFSARFPTDTLNKLVLNEEAVRQLGFTSSTAVGKKLFFDWQGETMNFEVIGVVKNYHFQSLHKPIKPFGFIRNRNDWYNYIVINAETTNMDALLKRMSAEWKKINPNEPFEYAFLDEEFMRNYKNDQRTFDVISFFTIVAILLSCLGLFGLSVYAAEQRIKEIGIRKVLGASVGGIVQLLSRDFLMLVLIAIIIASPVAWWAMNKWLQDFAYRINITWWVFVLAGVVALLIALMTVSFQAIKAAIANPVKSLRTE